MKKSLANTEKMIKVVDKNGKRLAPCKEKVAWVLINRCRAVKVDDTTIKIVLTKEDIRRIKKRAIARDDRICHYCGKQIPLDEPATADHITPKIIRNGKTGYDTIDNFVCACFDCNNHKDNMPYEDYVLLRTSTLLAIASIKSKISLNKLTNKLLNNIE